MESILQNERDGAILLFLPAPLFTVVHCAKCDVLTVRETEL